MVAILGANSVSGGYEVSNSLRFNDNDSAKLSLAFGSGGNTKTWTVSCWFKRGVLSSRQSFLNVGSSGSEYMSLYIDSDDKLYWVTESGGNLYRIGSTALFRDPSAWYHIVFRQDTTDGTANNRFRYYINGVEVDTGVFNAQPTQNFDGKIGGNDTHYIGSNRDGTSEFMDGYLTEYHYLDGISYAPTFFGEFDDNGVWIPKRYTGSHGTKGFFLEFQQTGTSANSSGIGADTSGNDNHFAPTNLAAQDVTTDTCTNNFATLNFLDGSYDSKLSEGNLVLDTSAGGSDIFGRGTIGFSQGKWYWEVKSIISGGHGNRKIVGVVDTETPVAHPRTVTSNPYTGVIVDLFDGDVFRNASGVSDAGTFATNDIVGILFDADNGLLRLQQNGSNLFSGNAVTTNAIDTTIFYLPYIAQDGGGTNNGKLFVNFGNPPAVFSISSGNSDANGHGNFEYAVPSGYFSICSKNLAEFG